MTKRLLKLRTEKALERMALKDLVDYSVKSFEISRGDKSYLKPYEMSLDALYERDLKQRNQACALIKNEMKEYVESENFEGAGILQKLLEEYKEHVM